MGLIKSACHFVVSRNGMRGHFVTADGNVGLELYSKTSALEALNAMVEMGMVQKDEVAIAREQVFASHLPFAPALGDAIEEIKTLEFFGLLSGDEDARPSDRAQHPY